MFVTLPGLEVRVGFTDEEHLAQFRVEGVGGEHEDRLLLLDAGEVKQVRVGDRNPRTVGVRRRDVVGVDDGEGAGGQPRFEAGAVFDEKSGGNGFVAHGKNEAGEGGLRNGYFCEGGTHPSGRSRPSAGDRYLRRSLRRTT